MKHNTDLSELSVGQLVIDTEQFKIANIIQFIDITNNKSIARNQAVRVHVKHYLKESYHPHLGSANEVWRDNVAPLTQEVLLGVIRDLLQEKESLEDKINVIFESLNSMK